MQIDPNQPIMFDNDAMPGVGNGYWQVNPFSANHRDDETEPTLSQGESPISMRTFRLMQAAVVTVAAGFVIIGGISTFLS